MDGDLFPMKPHPRLPLLILTALIIAGCAAVPPQPAPSHACRRTWPAITFTVTKGDFTIREARTPYDADPALRETYLAWFKRGVENALAGKQPLMVEWMDSPAGHASASGYDLGYEEGEKLAASHRSENDSFDGEIRL